MAVIGIDGSLKATAICGDTDMAVVPCGSPARSLAGRLERYRGGVSRIVDAVDLLSGDKPMATVCFLENYFIARATQTAIHIIEHGMALRLALSTHGVTVVEVAPTVLKKFVTGNGNANKATMISTLSRKYDVAFSSDDEADAYGLWRLGRCVMELDAATNADQRKAVADIQESLKLEREAA